MRYVKGSVKDHDHEVVEARWFSPAKAKSLLTFDNEKQLVLKAKKMLK